MAMNKSISKLSGKKYLFFTDETDQNKGIKVFMFAIMNRISIEIKNVLFFMRINRIYQRY